MSEDIYTRLREFMDKLPAGYPETPTGVEIKFLKKLWAPDEAELTMKLTNEPEEVSAVAGRIAMDEKELADKLEAMDPFHDRPNGVRLSSTRAGIVQHDEGHHREDNDHKDQPAMLLWPAFPASVPLFGRRRGVLVQRVIV